MDLVELVRAVHSGPLKEEQARAICRAIGVRGREQSGLLQALRREWPEFPWRGVRHVDASNREYFTVTIDGAQDGWLR